MATADKKKIMEKETITLNVGNLVVEVTPIPDTKVARANARIQKKIQPIFHQIKKTRRAAAITASKIVLNA